MSDWLKGFADQQEPPPTDRLLKKLQEVKTEPKREAELEKENERDPTKKELKFRPPERSPGNQPSSGPGFKTSSAPLTQSQREALEKQVQERQATQELERQRLADPDLLMKARQQVAEKRRTQEPLPLKPERELRPPWDGGRGGGGRKL